MASRRIPGLTEYVFDIPSDRYREVSTGRYVAWSQVRQQIDKVLDSRSSVMQGLTRDLSNGKISLETWLRSMAQEIKTSHLLASIAANGGIERMTFADYGKVGAQIKKQYKYLRNFGKQIESGDQKLDGRAVVRSGLYAQSARGEYEQIRRHHHGGEERRVLHARESCNDCISYAARGWQPVGSLPAIGESECGVHCRCTFEFRNRVSIDSPSPETD